MKLTDVLFVILVVSMLLLVGCSKKECSTRADCNAKGSCFIASCVKGVCDYREKSGCTCGNDVCDDGTNGSKSLSENPCTCPDDCGKCDVKVNDFTEKKCVDGECITLMSGQQEKIAEDNIVFSENGVTKLQMNLKLTYPEPFNVKQSLMKIFININKMDSDVSDVKITRVKIVGHTGSRDSFGRWVDDVASILFDKSYSKILFDESSSFDKEFPVLIDNLNADVVTSKILFLEVDYEFKGVDAFGRSISREGVFEKELTISLVNPGGTVKCPSSCDDNNPCTMDTCGPETKFFCSHTVSSRGICCGDDVCSVGEDRCQCPGDCGQCIGDVGDYMVMGCSAANRCTFQVKNKGLIKPVTKLSNNIDMSGVQMSITTVYDFPFDKSSSIFSFTFEPKGFSSVRNLVLKKVTLLDNSGTVLGVQTLSKPVLENSAATVSAMLSYQTLDAEESKDVSVVFDYSIEKQNSLTGEWDPAVNNDYTLSIGTMRILNPG